MSTLAALPPLLGLPGWHTLGLFMLATLVLNATPGVDLLLTVSRTLQGGRRAGVAAALGVSAGCIVHVLAAAFGLAALLALSAAAFDLLKWAGALYLMWLAWGLAKAAWQGDGDAVAAPAPPARTGWQDFRTGLLGNVLNPKVALFFLAFFPQFIAPGTANKTGAMLLLGLLFLLQSTLFLLAVVAVAGALRRLPSSPRGARLLQGGAALLFAALALRLALARQPAA